MRFLRIWAFKAAMPSASSASNDLSASSGLSIFGSMSPVLSLLGKDIHQLERKSYGIPLAGLSKGRAEALSICLSDCVLIRLDRDLECS